MSRVETLISFFGERRTGLTPQVPEQPDVTGEQAALIAEACSKSGVIWIRALAEEQTHLAWQTWHDGAVHVVYGVGEQPLLLLAGPVEVSVPSKDNRALLVRFIGQAQVLEPRSAAWEAAAAVLAAARLNSPDPAGQSERWASGCLISRVDAVHVLAGSHGADDAPSQAAPPRANPGTTIGRRPWHLGGRGR
jgi:hypothetical protein